VAQGLDRRDLSLQLLGKVGELLDLVPIDCLE
jgi:hypothetical protein